MVSVPADFNFASLGSTSYNAEHNANATMEPKENHEVPSLREIVAKELLLLERQKHLSVRELTKKFEKGLTTAAKPSDEQKWRETASLDRQVLLKMLRDLLESLKARVAGRNKDDAKEAISVSTEDAKKAVDDEKTIVFSVIETTRQAVHRVEQALHEQELISRDAKRNVEIQNLDEFMNEVQEARRIIMLHQPSKVMDMEHECQALRMQLTEKCMQLIHLRKELALNKRLGQNNSDLFELDGSESLGSCLRVVPSSPAAPDISISSIQWFRVLAGGSRKLLISGATKPVYAPEPFDVGQILVAEIALEDRRVDATTTGPIDPAPGLANYVEALVRNPETKFTVVVLQMNGKVYSSSSIHGFHVGTTSIKLCKDDITKAKEAYSTSMQLCGVRGGGNAAPLALFWQAKQGVTYTLAFESDRARNAAIMLARKFACDCNIMLMGPGDRDAEFICSLPDDASQSS